MAKAEAQDRYRRITTKVDDHHFNRMMSTGVGIQPSHVLYAEWEAPRGATSKCGSAESIREEKFVLKMNVDYAVRTTRLLKLFQTHCT